MIKGAIRTKLPNPHHGHDIGADLLARIFERLWHFSRGMVLHHIGYIFPRYIRGRYDGPGGAALLGGCMRSTGTARIP